MIECVWILTRAINQYDQDGEYFVNAYAQKPTAEQLIADGVRTSQIPGVLAGGGRSGVEDEWFFLIQMELRKAQQRDAAITSIEAAIAAAEKAE